MSSTTRVRRLGAAVCLAAGPPLLLAATAVAPWSTEAPNADTLRSTDAHRDALLTGDLLAFLATLALVAGSLGAMRLLARGAPRLALGGGILAVVGWTAGMALVGVDQILVAVAGPDVRGTVGPVLDARTGWVLIPVFMTLILGHVLGLILLGAAAIRGGVVSAWAGAALIAAPVVEVVAYTAADAKVVAVAAYALLTLGFGAIAARVVATSDVEWDDPAPVVAERRVRVPGGAVA